MERTPNLRYNNAVGLEFVLRANLNLQEENKMVAGHLAVKGGKYYAVLSYKNSEGKRIPKWISLGLPEKANQTPCRAKQKYTKAKTMQAFLL